MSYNLVDPVTGDLTQVAGRGRAEYGASTVRKGTITFENVSTPQWVTATVVFGTPMPDANYEIIVNADDGYVIDGMTSPLTISNKTINGFSVKIYVHVLTSFKISYTAFKLYSDVEYSNIVNSMPSNASASNKLVAKSDAVTKYNYTMVGTASLEDDIKTFVTALIALGTNTYAGSFNRSGNLGTAGNYSITVYGEEGTSTFASGYIVLGAGATGKAQYIVSYYKPTGSSEEWTIKKLVLSPDINDDSSPVDISSSFTPESWVSNLSVIAMRKGNVVTLYILCEGTLTDSSMMTKEICSGDLPTKYRPLQEQSCGVSGYQGNLNSGYMESRLTLSQNGHFALGEHFMVNATGGIFAFKWSLTYLV